MPAVASKKLMTLSCDRYYFTEKYVCMYNISDHLADLLLKKNDKLQDILISLLQTLLNDFTFTVSNSVCCYIIYYNVCLGGVRNHLPD